MSLHEQSAVQAPTWETHTNDGPDAESRGRTSADIGSECDAWLKAQTVGRTLGGVTWSTAEVDAYFARRRAESLD